MAWSLARVTGAAGAAASQSSLHTATHRRLNAADDPVKIRLAALVEEGDILSQEAANLVPESKRVKLEGDKIVASERTLLEQSNALTKAFAQYNADLAQQREAAKDRPDRCRPASNDADVKQACDSEATELSAQAAKLEERLAALQARRDALNVRIDQHNTARLKWDEHRRKQDARVDVSELDIQRWIDKARSFWATEGFSLLVEQAGNSISCARNQQPTFGGTTAGGRAEANPAVLQGGEDRLGPLGTLPFATTPPA